MQKADQAETPLHNAARLDDRKLIEQLIKDGADINAKDEQGNTPLAVAVGLDRGETKLDLEKTLYWVGQGANPSDTNEAGASVWWKSSAAAQNLMVSEMKSLDRRIALQEAASLEEAAPMRVPSPDPGRSPKSSNAEAGRGLDSDRYSSYGNSL